MILHENKNNNFIFSLYLKHPKAIYMERVRTLIEKLQKQITDNASADNLLVTVQMLQSELMKQAGNSPQVNKGKVTVMMPGNSFAPGNDRKENFLKHTPEPVKEEEKIIEVLKVDE